jgi:hypothetical protein
VPTAPTGRNAERPLELALVFAEVSVERARGGVVVSFGTIDQSRSVYDHFSQAQAYSTQHISFTH